MCEEPRSHMFTVNLSSWAPQAAAGAIISNSSESQETLDPPTCLSKPYMVLTGHRHMATGLLWGNTARLSQCNKPVEQVEQHLRYFSRSLRDKKQSSTRQTVFFWTHFMILDSRSDHTQASQHAPLPVLNLITVAVEVLCKLCPSPWGKAVQLVAFFSAPLLTFLKLLHIADVCVEPTQWHQQKPGGNWKVLWNKRLI